MKVFLIVRGTVQTDEAALPSMEELLGEHVDLGQVRKIGEGTFGEAFRGGRAVFKIVPMDGNLKVAPLCSSQCN